MIITNKYNLPQALVDAAHGDYVVEEGIISATTLLKGTKEILLTMRHRNEIVVDVSDMLWSIYGTAVHKVLDGNTYEPNVIKEERFYKEYQHYTVSGQPDYYNIKTKTLIDYKNTSVWKVVYGDFSDWERQLYIYSILLVHNGHLVKTGKISAMLRDHRDSEITGDYPIIPYFQVEYDITDDGLADTQKFITTRLDDVYYNSQNIDNQIPPCSPEERWAKPTTYAVMKGGNKRASRVLNTQDEAMLYIADKNITGAEIVQRPGQDVKCERYCYVTPWCDYYQRRIPYEPARKASSIKN